MTKPKKNLGAGMTSAIGGALVTFEQQIMRSRPTVEERYERRDEVSLASGEGGSLIVTLPVDPADLDPGVTVGTVDETP